MEHVQAALDGGVALLCLLEKKGLGGVVDEVVAEVLVAEVRCGRPWRGVAVGVHAYGGAVDY